MQIRVDGKQKLVDTSDYSIISSGVLNQASASSTITTENIFLSSEESPTGQEYLFVAWSEEPFNLVYDISVALLENQEGSFNYVKRLATLDLNSIYALNNVNDLALTLRPVDGVGYPSPLSVSVQNYVGSQIIGSDFDSVLGYQIDDAVVSYGGNMRTDFAYVEGVGGMFDASFQSPTGTEINYILMAKSTGNELVEAEK